jgi:adenine modification enzyme
MSKKKYIFSEQSSLWGDPELLGFGSDDFYIKEIDREMSIHYIKENHYSGKVTSNSYVHIGVYVAGNLVGVLQLGPAMNPASGGGVVKGTKNDEWMELNRMHLMDGIGEYPESKSIAYTMKYIKRKYRKIKWIQSFADERCGGFGIVYQACSFGFYGEHTSTFWVLDDVWYHNKAMTIKDPNKISPSEKYLQENKHRAKSHRLRQFRYIKFLDQRAKKNLILEEKPYPKHYKEGVERKK